MDKEREQFLTYCRKSGLRVTRERLAVFDEIFTQHGHIDAEQLLQRMTARAQKISRATVYRNLDLLVECGLVRKYRLGHRRFLYEHLHAGLDHDHLVCTHCGRVVEFVSSEIASLQREICRAHDFDTRHRTMQVLSLCVWCAKRDEPVAASSTELDEVVNA